MEIILLLVFVIIFICFCHHRSEGFWVEPKCACSCNYGQPNLGLTNGGERKPVYSSPFGYYEPVRENNPD